MLMEGFFSIPEPINEPIKNYLPNSDEREELTKALKQVYAEKKDIPMHIGGESVFTDNKENINPPHDIKRTIASFSKGDKQHVEKAINAALKAKHNWEQLSWNERASIFLKAAELIAGPYRAKINAATMVGQSKNIYQSEIDAACELIDFLRFNVHYMSQIYANQPYSNKEIWNKIDYRPLEGFVFALTPFNFTAIAGNLPTSAAMMGNTIVWKPAETQIYAANVFMEILIEAGLPKGVINLVYVDGQVAGDVIFKHPDFAGLHFTGSTKVFTLLWQEIAANLAIYKSYPRIVGETGGKDFIIVHNSANLEVANTAIIRGAFEFQGQKCSAASRVYIAKSVWPALKNLIIQDVKKFKIGPVDDYNNFINAVIDEKSFDKIVSYIEYAKQDSESEIILGGTYDKSKGYFINPTIILTKNPKSKTMVEEIFGPVLTIFVYEDSEFDKTLEIINNTSSYALTGAIIAKDRSIIDKVSQVLRHAAGNFYINDKCTGAVVGQQPFGGARKSGTNDKAGSILNLLRWVSPRTVKEAFIAPTDYKYPYMN
ncbi:MAG: L-glutamate gamma-semialdehyde dehydrogenase [Solitalea-like symbiont of Acarus siro]